MRLSPEQHLRTQSDFQNLRQVGRRYQCDAFTLWWGAALPKKARGENAAPALRRVGVVASRAAVGNAVQRNRAKRRLRELFRLHQDALPASGDLMLVARHRLRRLPWPVLQRRFLGIAEQLPDAPRAAMAASMSSTANATAALGTAAAPGTTEAPAGQSRRS